MRADDLQMISNERSKTALSDSLARQFRRNERGAAWAGKRASAMNRTVLLTLVGVATAASLLQLFANWDPFRTSLTRSILEKRRSDRWNPLAAPKTIGQLLVSSFSQPLM